MSGKKTLLSRHFAYVALYTHHFLFDNFIPIFSQCKDRNQTPKGSSDLFVKCFLLDLYVSFMITKEITYFWDSRLSKWICWPLRQVNWFSLAGDLDIGGTSLEPPADGLPLLALSRGLWAFKEGFLLLLMPLFLSHKVGGPLSNGDGNGDGDYGSCKRWPHWRFASLQDDRAVSDLNGDISILAWLIGMLNIGGDVVVTGVAGL